MGAGLDYLRRNRAKKTPWTVLNGARFKLQWDSPPRPAEAAYSALTFAGLSLAGAPPFARTGAIASPPRIGKITSVTSAGVIVKPLKSVSTEHRYTPYPLFAEECFVEMPTAGIYSDTILDVNVALIGDHDYESALHGHRQIPRTVCVGDNAAP